MKNNKTIRLATVGAGYFSRFQYAAWARIPEVELVGICDYVVESAQDVAMQYGVKAVYQDFGKMLDELKPDLIDIITPPITHTEFVSGAVDRGITTICQKPFTPSLEEARKLVEMIERKDAKVIIHENFRFQPWYQKLREMLNEDTMGELYRISYALRPGDGQGVDAYMDRQPYFQKMPRFLVHETAIHLIDVFRYLFGNVESVYADLQRINPIISGEDSVVIIFNFENGARGVFDGNRSSDHKADNRRLTMGELCIEGSKGVASLNGDAAISFRPHGENHEIPITYNWSNRDFGGDCVYRFQRHVVDHLVQGAEISNCARQYLTNIEIAEACYVSNETGSRIHL